MFIAVAIDRLAGNTWCAEAPDLADCSAEGDSPDQALAKLKLIIEGHVSTLLARGQGLPHFRPVDQCRRDDASRRWFETHINLAHLQAMVRHQDGRWT